MTLDAARAIERLATIERIRRAAEADPGYAETAARLAACGLTPREAAPLARAIVTLRRAGKPASRLSADAARHP